MKLIETSLDGVYIIENFNAQDIRGEFVKTFNHDDFDKHNLNVDWKESYFSVSQKNVIRGMHFQIPPHDHHKLVYVAKGAILDVVLDIRKDSSTYGKYEVFEINEKNHRSIYIPKGMAHGFLSLEDNTITVYNVSTVYDASSDAGVRYDSFGYHWNNVEHPIVSGRDLTFSELELFKSPF